MTHRTETSTDGGEPPEDDGVSGAVTSLFGELEGTFDNVVFSVVEPLVGPSQHVAEVPREVLITFVSVAKELGFKMFIDLCGVDYLRRAPRFEVVITLLSLGPPARLRIRVPVPGTDPSVPSITSVYPGANFYERETYDLFGIDFPGHPDLSRILLPDDWEGHPLRKDYAVGSIPVRFKGAHKAT